MTAHTSDTQTQTSSQRRHTGGQRCPLKYSRAIVDAIHSGDLAKAPTKVDAHFGLHYPTECKGVPAELLDRHETLHHEGASCMCAVGCESEGRVGAFLM